MDWVGDENGPHWPALKDQWGHRKEEDASTFTLPCSFTIQAIKMPKK
jgi:hypothetical protein